MNNNLIPGLDKVIVKPDNTILDKLFRACGTATDIYTLPDSNYNRLFFPFDVVVDHMHNIPLYIQLNEK